jgi:heme exporter protein A
MTFANPPGLPAAPTSSASLPSLRLVNLACRRGDHTLFTSLNLTLESGALLWLRGGNGRGKTSLLRIVAGLAAPESGQVSWGDEPARRSARFARELVYIGHANALKDDLTAAEALTFLAILHGRDAGNTAIRAALRTLGLAGRERTPVRSLSQGLRRRVALARLALEDMPGVWVLDEPFDALDVAGAAVLHDLLAANRARGGSVLLTSHHLHLDARAADAGFRVIDLDTLSVPSLLAARTGEP